MLVSKQFRPTWLPNLSRYISGYLRTSKTSKNHPNQTPVVCNYTVPCTGSHLPLHSSSNSGLTCSSEATEVCESFNQLYDGIDVQIPGVAGALRYKAIVQQIRADWKFQQDA